MCIQLCSWAFRWILSNFFISRRFNSSLSHWLRKLSLAIVEPLDISCVHRSWWLWVKVTHFTLSEVVHCWLVEHCPCILVLLRRRWKYFIISICLHLTSLSKDHAIFLWSWYAFLVVFILRFILVCHNKLFLLQPLCWGQSSRSLIRKLYIRVGHVSLCHHSWCLLLQKCLLWIFQKLVLFSLT